MDELNLSNRRRFIKQSLYGSIGMLGLSAIPFDVFAKTDLVKLTVLHTNDVHSHIEPFPDNDPKYPGLGGVARRAALIKEIRNIEKNVLLLDAGDIYQGTPYFNKYGGELELKLMSQMGYDASAIGNHDFDNGLEGIVNQLHNANFPLLCSNYDFSNTIMNGKTAAYKIFEKEGIKIGVFGIGIELDGLVDKKLYGNTIYQDPLEKAAQTAILLKKELKCDLVICLSHLGYSYQNKKVSDFILAKQSRYIDLIIGGHTHTFLEKPVNIRNRDGQEIHICQVGWAGLKLGRVDFYFEQNGKKKHVEGSAMNVVKRTEDRG